MYLLPKTLKLFGFPIFLNYEVPDDRYEVPDDRYEVPDDRYEWT